MDIKTMAETHFKRLQKRLKKNTRYELPYIASAYDSKGALLLDTIIKSETKEGKRRQQELFQMQLQQFLDVSMVVSAFEAWVAPDDGSGLLPSQHPAAWDALWVSAVTRGEQYSIVQPFSVTSGRITWGKVERAHLHGSDVYSSCTDILWSQPFEWSGDKSQKAEGF